MKKRMANMEFLRNIAMMMVVMLHYLSKGHFLAPLTISFAKNNYVAWLMEAFAIVAVNVYMLISGYFLVESQVRFKRILNLIAQVLFYSILIPFILIILSAVSSDIRLFFVKSGITVLSLSDVSFYQLIQYIFPVQMEHYWFITAYVTMYLMAPVLAKGAKALSQKELRNVVLGLLAFEALFKSILPVKLQMDKLGYDAIWFITVFLLAAYVRLYGIPFFKSAIRSFLCYLLSVALIYGLTMGVRMVYFETGRFADFIQNAYHYNHVLNIFGALSLFYTFYHIKLDEQENFGKICVLLGPYSLGVYLLHEQVEVRWAWPSWFGATINVPTWMLILKALLTVFVVFAIGIAVDIFRSRLFSLFHMQKTNSEDTAKVSEK